MSSTITTIKRGEIWFADLNYMSSSEKTSIQQGLRPVICLSNNKCNTYSPTITVIPLSSNINKMKKVPTHVLVGLDSGLKSESIALCEQSQTIDKSRLKFKIGEVTETTMAQLENAVMIQVGINNQIMSLNFEYVREIMLSIRQLDILAKQLNQQIKAKQLLMKELMEYCAKLGRDYKEVIKETKEYFKTKELVYV